MSQQHSRSGTTKRERHPRSPKELLMNAKIKKKFASDLDQDDSGGTEITQSHNKPVDSVCCKSDKLSHHKTTCSWISTAVSL